MKCPSMAFKGFGNVSSTAIGAAEFSFIIDDEEYDSQCHTVKDEYIPEDMLIGLDILNQAELVMKLGRVTLKKIEEECDQDNPKFINRITAINIVDKSNEPKVDLSHIEDVNLREEVQLMINNYAPKITQKSGVEMKDCLTDEVPVYEKPRRLAPKEKEIINNTIQEWIGKGICRPSNSEFASAVVLRPKKTPVCGDYA